MPLAGRMNPKRGKMKKILIVDDEPTILMTMSHLLGSSETTVITCERMEEAEEALARYAFNLVIADLRLSGMYGVEGLELLSFIKGLNSKTEVIIMTAYGTHEIEEKAYQAGAFHYYEKPIDLTDLAARIRTLGIAVSHRRTPPAQLS